MLYNIFGLTFGLFNITALGTKINFLLLLNRNSSHAFNLLFDPMKANGMSPHFMIIKKENIKRVVQTYINII